MINVVRACSKKWCFEANVTKFAVVVFRNKKTFDGEWFCGNTALPHHDCHNYLGVKFTYSLHRSASLYRAYFMGMLRA